MKDNKKILIIAAIVLIIIIFIICIILGFKLLKGSREKRNYLDIPPAIEVNPIIEPEIRKLSVTSYSDTVKLCVKDFFKYYYGVFAPQSSNSLVTYSTEDDIERARNNNIEAIYSILDDSYKTFKNITLDNLQSKINQIQKADIYIDDDIYVSQKNENISIYFVTGKLTNIENKKTAPFNILVCMDMKNRNYSVFLSDYIEKYYPNINVGEKVSFENIPDEIINKKYNNFIFQIGR